MIFCKECGGALNLFQIHDEEVCYTCLRKGIKQEQKAAPARVAEEDDPLLTAAVSHEDGKIVLRSPEGWILWSCPDSEAHSLTSIISRARRIHQIRSKRQK
jgi:hypothetical protein